MEAVFSLSHLCWILSNVLLLNTHSGKISPQFCVVFDDWLTSVLSMGADDAFDPQKWHDLSTTSQYQYTFDDDDQGSLSPEWTLTEQDFIANQQHHEWFRMKRETIPSAPTNVPSVSPASSKSPTILQLSFVD